jgi:hypothetical protein
MTGQLAPCWIALVVLTCGACERGSSSPGTRRVRFRPCTTAQRAEKAPSLRSSNVPDVSIRRAPERSHEGSTYEDIRLTRRAGREPGSCEVQSSVGERGISRPPCSSCVCAFTRSRFPAAVRRTHTAASTLTDFSCLVADTKRPRVCADRSERAHAPFLIHRALGSPMRTSAMTRRDVSCHEQALRS